MFHQILGFSYIYKTSGYDIRSCKNNVAVSLQCHDNDHNAVFCKVLTVTKDNVSDITDTKTVYKNCSCLNGSCYLSTVFIHFKNVAGFKDKDIFFRDTEILNHMFLCGQMAVFTMNRNCIFRMYQ